MFQMPSRMNRVAAGTLVLAGLLANLNLASAQSTAVRPTDRPPIQPKATQQAESADATAESLDVRYARAHLKLAQLDLERALEVTRQVPGSMTEPAIANLKKHVAIDRAQLEQAIQAPEGARAHQIYVRTAEIAVAMAESDAARKRRVYERSPSKLKKLDVERATAMLNLARLQKEQAESQEGSLYSLPYLQWQIELLRNDLLELRIKVETQHDR